MQEKHEAEALDLSPGEIIEQTKKHGSSGAVNRAKRTQAMKLMQNECARIVAILHKHDPIKDFETKLAVMLGKDNTDLDKEEQEAGKVV